MPEDRQGARTSNWLALKRAVPLRSRSCIIDGEAVACGEDGIAAFERIRYRRHDACVFMWAFDLIELNGDGLRREPLERRSCWLTQGTACSSMSTWKPRGRGCSSMRAAWGSKGSCRSGRARDMSRVARVTG
jgi:hypothetical protein